MRQCYGCAGTEEEGCVLPLRKRNGRRLYCQECEELKIHAPFVLHKVFTRATELRRWRKRQESPQMDLIDLVVGAP